MWIGLFDERTKEQLQEWEGVEKLPNDVNRVDALFFERIEEGYVCSAHYFIRDMFPDGTEKGEILLLFNNKIEGIKGSEGLRLYVYENTVFEFGNKPGKLFSIKGETLVSDVSYYHKGDSTFLAGFKNDGKVWFGLYGSKNNVLGEWSSQDKFERTIEIYNGYGEYSTYYMEYLLDLHDGDLGRKKCLETDWGYAFDVWNGLFILNENYVYFVSSKDGMNVSNWFNGSILAGTKVISSKGELIVTLKNTNPYGGEAVSYTDALSMFGSHESLTFVRCDLKEGKEIWRTMVEKLENIQSNAKVLWTITKKDGLIWYYHFEVVNYDGSKELFDLSLNVETGEVMYM